MRGGLWIDVVEGQHEVGFEDDVRGNFAGYNFLEERHGRARLNDHERELCLLLMPGNDIAQVLDDLVIELLAAGAPLLGTGEFLHRGPQAFYAEQLRFAVQIGVDLIAQGAEKHHLESVTGFVRLAGDFVEIRLSGLFL